jgi:hypothetical protein
MPAQQDKIMRLTERGDGDLRAFAGPDQIPPLELEKAHETGVCARSEHFMRAPG